MASEQAFQPLPQVRKLAWKYMLRNAPLIAGALLIVVIFVLVFFGPYMSPHNPFETVGLTRINGKLTAPPFPPSADFPWGTDPLGRDILSLILAGAQQTLSLAVFAVGGRALLGVLLGALAGWDRGSALDRLVMSLAEIISAFPTLLFAMILILALGIRQGMPTFVIALAFTGWGEIMQFVRGEMIHLRSRPFVESAVAVGAPGGRIITRHLLPNLFTSLVSIIALEMGAVLMLLGELGFIGIFIGGGSLIALPSTNMHYSDVPEWGALLSNVRNYARSYPWTALYPMLAFFISILSFNLLGEGLRRMLAEGNLLLNRLFNRYTFVLALVALLAFSWLQGNSGAIPIYKELARQFDARQAYGHLQVLSDPGLQGRALGTSGGELAATYIAGQFEAYGLQAGGESGSYFQTRQRAFGVIDSPPALDLGDAGPPLELGTDYQSYPGRNFPNGQSQAPLRVVGLGMVAEVGSSAPGFRTIYSTLDRIDLSESILMVFSDREAAVLSAVEMKGMLIVASDPDAMQRRYTYSGRSGGGLNLLGLSDDRNVPYLWINPQTADRLLAGSGNTVASLRQKIAELPNEAVLDLPVARQPTLSVQSTLVEKWPVKNVLGLLPGSLSFDQCEDCLGQQLIVVIAQYDSPPLVSGMEPIQAANDNASGVAVMLEAIRILNQTEYTPYKSFLFVAYSGEGLDGGESVKEPDVTRFLQARSGFGNFRLEAIVKLRGLAAGSGDRLEISAQGSLRLAELLERSGRQVGVRSSRAEEDINLGVIYNQSTSRAASGATRAPTVQVSWAGWQTLSYVPADTLENITLENIQDAGRTLAMALMVLGRETEY